MASLFSLSFQFEDAEHFCLITPRGEGDERFFKITIMNGELEKLLNGDNLIKESNGILESPVMKSDRQGQLKSQIAEALQHHLELTQATTV